MFEYHTLAIVLKKEALNEADANVILYTKELGKLEIIAKGIKKTISKFGGHLEPLNLIEATIIAVNNKHLTSVLTVDNFSLIREDYLKLENALKMIGIFNEAIVSSEKDEFIWEILLNYLKELNETIIPTEEKKQFFIQLLNLQFLIRLGRSLGVLPDKEELREYFDKNTASLIIFLSQNSPQDIIEKYDISKLQKIDYNKIEKSIKQKIII
ncbi:MAG: DNA repair protein RecO [Patescibacteria group bacterium]